ncbi:MAG TPA: hypothetical protein VG320_26340 [Paraburkholderia sp.]|jgi:hypothetical protein|uniref:hypothetical protein n=1 Tax=Paraburkholderia sp. TaxID=1926495 RepID=UPI002DF0860C|nr:hypothetical protein [Paraburkholderia sp.]
MNGNQRSTARKLALIAVMAGAGQAQAQAVCESGWARISPGAGYGFGFWMEVATRSTDYAGERPNPYDLLYTVKSRDTATARRHPDAIDSAAVHSSVASNVDGVLGRLESTGAMTRVLGVNEPVPMMIFTGAISSRGSSGLPGFDRSIPFDMPSPVL